MVDNLRQHLVWKRGHVSDHKQLQRKIGGWIQHSDRLLE